MTEWSFTSLFSVRVFEKRNDLRGKDDLFKLIKAMSKSEKRYFSLDAQKSGKKASRYLDLFRHLNDQDDWDETKLKKKFPKNLSSDKAYLYDAILRSMRDYRSPKSKAAQIKEKIQDSRYLFERGLYKQCDLRLQEAQVLAEELGDELMILEVTREKLLTIKSNKEKNFVKYVEDLLVRKTNALENVNQFFKYSDAYYNMLIKVTKNFSSPPHEREHIDLPDFFTEEQEEDKSTRTQHRFYQVNALYHQLQGNKEQVLKFFEETVAWWDEHPVLKNEEYYRYIVDVSSLIYSYIENKRYKEAEECLEELAQNMPQNLHEERLWRKNLHLNQLVLMLNLKNYDKARELLPEIEESIIKYGLTENAALLGNIGILYFLVGQYEKSHKWLSRINSSTNTALRFDVQILGRILSIVCLIELENEERLDSEFRSLTRFFKSRNLPRQRFEVQVTGHLSSIAKANLFEIKQLKKDLKVYLISNWHNRTGRDDLIEPLMQWVEPALILTR